PSGFTLVGSSNALARSFCNQVLNGLSGALYLPNNRTSHCGGFRYLNGTPVSSCRIVRLVSRIWLRRSDIPGQCMMNCGDVINVSGWPSASRKREKPGLVLNSWSSDFEK